MLISCSKPRQQGVFIDPAFGTLVPPDSRFFVGVRLDKLRKTGLYKRWNAKLDLDRRLDLFSTRTGLDQRTEIWQVLAASNGSELIVLARGRFSVGELEPKLDSLGKSRTRFGDYTLIGSPQTSVVFLNPGVAAAGTQAVLENMLKHRGEWAGYPKALTAQYNALPAEAQIWAASSAPLPEQLLQGTDATGAKSMAANLVGLMKSGRFAITTTDGIDVDGTVDCLPGAAAQQMNDALRGFLGLARLTIRDDQHDLLPVFDAVKIARSGEQVTLNARLTPQQADTLLTAAASRR